MGAGQDLGRVGEVLGLLFPDDIGGDQGKSAGGVVLWAQVRRNCLCFFEPRLEVDAWFVGKRRGEGGEFQLSHDGGMDGWMDGLKILIATVDTSATGTKQCEAITNVAIRIMRIKGMDEQRKIKIDCVII